MHTTTAHGRWSTLLVAAALLFSTISVPIAASAAPQAPAPTPAPAPASTPAPGPCDVVVPGAFSDVVASNVHAANIDCVATHRIVLGVGGGRYGPDGPVNRGHMASFLVNLVEVATAQARPAPVPAAFQDVAGTTHHHNILIARQLGIARGVTSTAYAPGSDVSRAQMATFVAQAIAAAGGSLPSGPPDAFTDDDGSIHEANIDALAAARVVLGTGGGRYEPDAPVSRAQMATYLANAARFLHSQSRWPGGDPEEDEPDDEVDAEQPELTDVSRPGTEADVIDLRWSTPVGVVDPAASFRVLGADGVALVAQGSSLASAQEQTLRLTLSAALEGGVTYWLSVPHGAVRHAEDDAVLSDVQTHAFVFPVRAEDGSDDGSDEVDEADDGAGDGAEDGSDEADDGAGDGADDGSGDGADDGSDEADDGSGDDGSDGSDGSGDDEVVAMPLLTNVTVDGTAMDSGDSLTTQQSTPVVAGLAAAEGSTVSTVQYRIGDGEWRDATATDGAFDSAAEAFTATLEPLSVGSHELVLQAHADNDLRSGLYSVTLEVGPVVPTVTGVTTDPDNDRLVVAFSDPVVCPSTANARGAWYFRNLRDEGSEPISMGAPLTVSDVDGSDGICFLYFIDGIDVGDYGYLDYTQPAGADNQVKAIEGAPLETVSGLTVTQP